MLVKRYPDLLLIFSAILLSFPLYASGGSSDTTYKNLVTLYRAGNEDKFEKSAFSFLKANPDSIYVPEVKMMLAEIESDTELAAERFRAVVKNYPSYEKRELALYKLCQILELKSRWKELRNESASGMKIFSSGPYVMEFRFIHINSLIMLEDYDNARIETLDITEKTHDFEILARAIFMLSEIDRRTTGNSKSYIYSLKELAQGFGKSELYPSILYRLGEYYEYKKDTDRAYSALSDLVKQFPDSPEASLAVVKIEKLRDKNPRKIDYIPDNEAVKNSDNLDISPDYEVAETDEEIFFSISIGPFTKKTDAERMNRLLKNYPAKRTVKARSGYFIYIGKFTDTDMAFQSRIRLAEEYGINGNIVRFSEQGNRSYIYGD